MMKRIAIILVTAITVMSCKNYPDMDNLNNDYLVQTEHDADVDFKTRYANGNNTYYMPDTILLVSDSAKDTIWINTDAKLILNKVAEKLDAYGYKRITDPNRKRMANLGVMITYVRDLHVTDYSKKYWWDEKHLHWNASYWGWLPWYYPFNKNYKYATGSVIIEIVDPNYEPRKSRNSTVVWLLYGRGILSNYQANNIQYAIDAIDQAFLQSAYLTLK